jgi:hypothetical protein
MRWAVHIAHKGNEKCVQDFGWKASLEGRDHSDDLGVDRILKCILGKQVLGCGLDSSG